MHSHQLIENRPFWKEMLSAIPVVGSLWNANNNNYFQVADNALYDASSITGQVACMYLFPFELTANFPHVSNDPDLQMNVKMGTEMTLRMEIGDVGGKILYKLSAEPIKKMINSCGPETFNQNAKDFAVNIAQLLPLIGPFLGEEDWKKAVKNGVVENIEQLSMLITGATFMMLSPYGMEEDAVSVSVGTLLMMAGMTSAMLVHTIGHATWKKSVECLTSLSLWKPVPNNESSPILVSVECGETTLSPNRIN